MNYVCCPTIITVYFYWMQSVWLLGHGLDDRGLVVRFLVRASDFLLSETSRLVLVPTQPPFQWAQETLYPEFKTSAAWSSLLASIWCGGWEWVELHLHSLQWLYNILKDLTPFSWKVWCLHFKSVFLHKMDWFLSFMTSFFQMHYLFDVEFWRVCEW
jgi:hypothetical protein